MAKEKTTIRTEGINWGVGAFIIGAIIAMVYGFIPGMWKAVATAILVIAGIVIGFMNITEEETTPFLVASVAIMIALFTAGAAIDTQLSSLGGVVGGYLKSLLSSINVLVFPATMVVALKSIYKMSKD